MFARLTADNRITLPDSVVCDFPDVQVFDVVNVRWPHSVDSGYPEQG